MRKGLFRVFLAAVMAAVLLQVKSNAADEPACVLDEDRCINEFCPGVCFVSQDECLCQIGD